MLPWIEGTATDDAADHLVALGYQLLDAVLQIGRRGVLFGHYSLVALYAALFSWRNVVIYEVGSQQFVGYV
jgi:hypothetical protein